MITQRSGIKAREVSAEISKRLVRAEILSGVLLDKY